MQKLQSLWSTYCQCRIWKPWEIAFGKLLRTAEELDEVPVQTNAFGVWCEDWRRLLQELHERMGEFVCFLCFLLWLNQGAQRLDCGLFNHLAPCLNKMHFFIFMSSLLFVKISSLGSGAALVSSWIPRLGSLCFAWQNTTHSTLSARWKNSVRPSKERRLSWRPRLAGSLTFQHVSTSESQNFEPFF